LHSLGNKLSDNEILEIVKQRSGAWVFHRPVGGIGDAVMLLPAITALKKQVGNDLLVVSCVDYIAPVFEHHPYVDYVMSYTGAEISEGKDEVVLGELENAGSVIHRYYHPCPASVYEAEHNPDITKPRQDIFCEHAGVEFDINNYCLTLTREEKELPFSELKGMRYIVVQVRSHDLWRNYLHMKWLLDELAWVGKKKDFLVVTVDSAIDPGMKGVVSYTHKSLRWIFGMISGAMLLIGPDSAFVHVAGALNVPILGLFGPTNPAVRLRYHNAHWMPRFKRCPRQYCWYKACAWRFCLATLRPRKIIRRVKDLIMEAV
jgi:hypothetical protein